MEAQFKQKLDALSAKPASLRTQSENQELQVLKDMQVNDALHKNADTLTSEETDALRAGVARWLKENDYR